MWKKQWPVVIKIRNFSGVYLDWEILKYFSLIVVKTNACSHSKKSLPAGV